VKLPKLNFTQKALKVLDKPGEILEIFEAVDFVIKAVD
jgi:hypothetical protein